MKNTNSFATQALLKTLLEFAVIAVLAFAVISIGWTIVGQNPLQKQLVVWLANVVMLIIVWLMLHRRHQNWE